MSPASNTAYDLRVKDDVTERSFEYVLQHRGDAPAIGFRASSPEIPMSTAQSITASGGSYSVRDLRGLWMIPTDNWSAGAFQDTYDSLDAAPDRFLRSQQADVSQRGTVRIGMGTETVAKTDLADFGLGVASGDYLYTSGEVGRADPGPCWGFMYEHETDTWSELDFWNEVGKTTHPSYYPITAFATDGEYVYAAIHATGADNGAVYRAPSGDTDFIRYNTDPATAYNIVGLCFSGTVLYAVQAALSGVGGTVGTLTASGYSSLAGAAFFEGGAAHIGIVPSGKACHWLVSSQEKAWLFKVLDGAEEPFTEAASFVDGFTATALCSLGDATYVGGYFTEYTADGDEIYTARLYMVAENQIIPLGTVYYDEDKGLEHNDSIHSLVASRDHIYVITRSNIYRWNLANSGLTHVAPVTIVDPLPPGEIIPPEEAPWFKYELPGGWGGTIQFADAGATGTWDFENLTDPDGVEYQSMYCGDKKWLWWERPLVEGISTIDTTEIVLNGWKTVDTVKGKKVTTMFPGVVGGGMLGIYTGSECILVRLKETYNSTTGVRKVYVAIGSYVAGEWVWTESGAQSGTEDIKITITRMAGKATLEVNKAFVGSSEDFAPSTRAASVFAGCGWWNPTGTTAPTSFGRRPRLRIKSAAWYRDVATGQTIIPPGNSLTAQKASIFYRGRVVIPQPGEGLVWTTPAVPIIPSDDWPCFIELSDSSFHMPGIQKGFYAVIVDHDPLRTGQVLTCWTVVDGVTAGPHELVEEVPENPYRTAFRVDRMGTRTRPRIYLWDTASRSVQKEKLTLRGISTAFLVPTANEYSFYILGYEGAQTASGPLWGYPADEAIEFLQEMAAKARVCSWVLPHDSFSGFIKSIDYIPAENQARDSSDHQGVLMVKVQRL